MNKCRRRLAKARRFRQKALRQGPEELYLRSYLKYIDMEDSLRVFIAEVNGRASRGERVVVIVRDKEELWELKRLTKLRVEVRTWYDFFGRSTKFLGVPVRPADTFRGHVAILPSLRASLTPQVFATLSSY